MLCVFPQQRKAWRPLVLAVVLALSGCSTLPMAKSLRVAPSKSTLPVGKKDRRQAQPAFRDVVGVMHIHTRYSDGSGTFEEISRIANNQKLDFLVVTDHNTLAPLRDKQQGWRGTTLVLVGTELSTPAGHYLALGITEEIDRDKLNTQQVINAVARQGGLGFIAHPYGRRVWTDWSVRDFTGLEIYNAKHDSLDENWRRLALWTLTSPPVPFYFSLLDRPYDPLSRWDTFLSRGMKVVGVGGADAHEYRIAHIKFAPYEILFRFIRNHVLIEGDELSPAALYSALRKGHVYVALELTAEARGFSFEVRDGAQTVAIMGDTLAYRPGLQLSVSSPGPATLHLYADGIRIAESTGTRLQHAVTQAGVYRIEAYRHDKPWVFTNPIFIEGPS